MVFDIRTKPSPYLECRRVPGVPLHLLKARLRKLENLEVTESWNSIETEVVALSYDIVADAIDKLSEDRVDVEAEKVCEND